MKLMKTLAGLLVAGSCMIGSGERAYSETLSSEPGTLFSEDFDGYGENSQLGSEWTVQGKKSGSDNFFRVRSERPFGLSGKSLFVQGSPYWIDAVAKFEPSEKIVLDFNIYPRNTSPYISLRGDMGVDISLFFDSSDNLFKIHYFDHSRSVVMPYTPNNWYHVRREINLSTNEGSLFIEDLSDPSKNALISLGRDNLNNYINEFGIHMPGGNIPGSFIDNISVAVPEPSALGLLFGAAGIGAGALALKRRKDRSRD